MAANKNTAQIKQKGDRGGVNPGGSGLTGRMPYGALPGSGQADSVGQRPKKTRTVGTGEH